MPGGRHGAGWRVSVQHRAGQGCDDDLGTPPGVMPSSPQFMTGYARGRRGGSRAAGRRGPLTRQETLGDAGSWDVSGPTDAARL